MARTTTDFAIGAGLCWVIYQFSEVAFLWFFGVLFVLYVSAQWYCNRKHGMDWEDYVRSLNDPSRRHSPDE